MGGEGGAGGLGAAIAGSTPKPSESRAAKGEPSESKPSAKAYIEAFAAAKEAARNDNWSLAGLKAKEALQHSPSDPDALSVLAIAACNLGDRGTAERAITQLKGNRQTMMKQICASKGLTIE